MATRKRKRRRRDPREVYASMTAALTLHLASDDSNMERESAFPNDAEHTSAAGDIGLTEEIERPDAKR